MGKIRKKGYTRSITSLYRVMQRLGIYRKTPSKKKKYEPKPYQQMTYPGERIQVDVKYVPDADNGNEVDVYMFSGNTHREDGVNYINIDLFNIKGEADEYIFQEAFGNFETDTSYSDFIPNINKLQMI